MKKSIRSAGNFVYKEHNKDYRLAVHPLHMELITNVDLKVPKGVWKIETGIHLVPAYLQLIDIRGVPDLYTRLRFWVYDYIVVDEEMVHLVVCSEDMDIVIPANTTIAILTPMLAAHDTIEPVRM